MEDGMILNKSSIERGFGHGTVYKSYLKPVNDQSKTRYRLLNDQKECHPQIQEALSQNGLDKDGLPKIGANLSNGQAELCLLDKILSKPKLHKFKDNEDARVETIRLMANEKSNDINFGFTLRYGRNPVIGDKFSSRHG